jgi:hypothetical protein
MWCELIERLTTNHKFFPPVSQKEIQEAEKKLMLPLPSSLKELLLETNGINDKYGSGLIWPLQRIVNDNQHFRTFSDYQELYMPFDSLLFFADAGNGDQFAFAICRSQVRRPDIYVWNHENDSRTWQAPSLHHYLDWWLTGRIKL